MALAGGTATNDCSTDVYPHVEIANIFMFDRVYHILVVYHVFDVSWFNVVQPRLDLLGLTSGRHATVVEFGCGYGTFTIPVP